jgi:hypothetical protein
MGWIRENVDSWFCVGAAALGCGGFARWRNRGLSAAKEACRKVAPRRQGSVFSRMAFEVTLREGMDMREGPG